MRRWIGGTVLELLTGSGLAAAAGMNAYIPLLAIVAPVLVLVALALLALLGWSLWRTARRRRNADLRSATQRLAER